jgi:hypothetical protein
VLDQVLERDALTSVETLPVAKPQLASIEVPTVTDTEAVSALVYEVPLVTA